MSPESEPSVGKHELFLDTLNNSSLASYRAAVRARYGSISFAGLPSGSEQMATDVSLDRLFVPPKVSENHLLPESFDEPRPDQSPPPIAKAPLEQGPLISPGQPQEVAQEPHRPPPTQDIADALVQNRRLVLLGDPGAGKSTLVRWITASLCQAGGGSFLESKLGGAYVPLIFILRELALPAAPTWDDLIGAFLKTDLATIFQETPGLLEKLLELGQVFFILDGYDELGGQTRRDEIRTALWEGWTRYPSCRWLVTSRVVGYNEAVLDEFKVLKSKAKPEDEERITKAGDAGFKVSRDKVVTEDNREDISERVRYATLSFLAPMDDNQMKVFSDLWWQYHSNNTRSRGPDSFLRSLKEAPGARTLARNPTLLTLCCFFYRNEGSLPDGRFFLYQKICETYLQTMEAVRQQAMMEAHRQQPLPIEGDPGYPLEERMSWLAAIAFSMQTSEPAEGADVLQHTASNSFLLTSEEWVARLATAIEPHPNDTTRRAAQNFFDYLHRRSGLVAEMKNKKRSNTPLYAFVHPSFQEFFAGYHLAKLWIDPDWQSSKDGDETQAGSRKWFRTVAGHSRAREMFVFAWEGISRHHHKNAERMLERLLGWPEDPEEWQGHEFATFLDEGKETKPDEKTSFVEVFAALANNPTVIFDRTAKLEGPVRKALVERCWRFQLGAYRILEVDRRHPGDYVGVAKLLLARPYQNDMVIGLLEQQLQLPKFRKELEHLNFSHCPGLTRLPKLPPGTKITRIVVYKCPALSETARSEFKQWCLRERGVDVKIVQEELNTATKER